MRPCFAVEIVTPKKFVLNGLWMGPKRPKRAIVWVHGLGSNMFSKLGIADRLIDKDTAVLSFNNRGHDKVASVGTTGGKRLRAGSAHEKFVDCVDDIQGAINFARRRGVKNIFLVGHSTGCQKSVYWASKKGRGVKGIVLLAPISDVSAEVFLRGKKKVARAAAAARAFLAEGKSSRLLPENVWHETLDAQRFLSLYSGEGPEEMFTYWDPARKPRVLRSLMQPTLVLLAERDEYADRPAKEIAAWFEEHVQNGPVVVLPRAPHSFHGTGPLVANIIKQFIRELKI